MAEIFLATQTGAQGFERTVILKRILPAFSMDPHFRNMIVDEAHIAMSLGHGNIVQVLDLGEVGGRYFLVMDLVDGWDLASTMMRAYRADLPLPPGLCLYVVAEVCRALAYAHGKTRDGKPLEIVHRDISPQNVLLSAEGEVKLTDFGIAKALGKRERTQTGVIKGKLDFMSPEQATGATIDGRSDIFSTGTLLYLLTTGQRPFEAQSELQTMVKIQDAEFAPPQEAEPSIDPRIAEVITKAMRKLPSERYGTADEMMRAVEDVLRAGFPSAGQSELRRYLDELGRKDGVPPLSLAHGLPMDEVDEMARASGNHTVALKTPNRTELALDDTRFVPPLESETAQAGVDRAPKRRASLGGRIGGLLAALVLLAAVVGGTLYAVSPQTARRLVNIGKKQIATSVPVLREAKVDKPATLAAPEPAPSPAAQPPRPAPEREAPSRPTLVTVQLKTRPAGATVRNQAGGVVGTTPLSMSWRSGTVQRLTFSKPGFTAATRRLTVPSKSHALVVDLARTPRRRTTARR